MRFRCCHSAIRFDDLGWRHCSHLPQFGVLLSRSSVGFFQIQQIWILTGLQALNFAVWFCHALNPFLPLWLQFVLMVQVGLLGGFMYVNVFYLLVRETKVPEADKELGINLTAIFINFGIVLSAITEIILDKTILADAVERTK